jgi:hypothetical protein
LYEAQEAQEAAEFAASREYLAACQKVDANAVATFAPMTTDWNEARGPCAMGSPRPLRVQRLHEVMGESLDYSNGPSMVEAMQLILNVAYSANLVNAPAQARALLARMANAWASQNVTVEG